MNIDLSKETYKDLKLFNLEYPFTKVDLKKKYRDLVMKFHPDVNPNIDEEKIKRINNSFKNLSKIALERINVKKSLSQELKERWDQEDEDIFSLFNPCPKCEGRRVVYRTITVSKECPKCDGSGFVELKCKYCKGTGLYTTKYKGKVQCKACNGTGIWKKVRCNSCNKNYTSRSLWWSFVGKYYSYGTIYEEKQIEEICPTCEGRGKVKYEPLNPVIKKGAILRAKNKNK